VIYYLLCLVFIQGEPRSFIRGVQRLHQPSIEEFERYVRRNEPLIITGGMENWNKSLWEDEHLESMVGHRTISVRTSTSLHFKRGEYGKINITMNEFLQKTNEKLNVESIEPNSCNMDSHIEISNHIYAAQLDIRKELPEIVSIAPESIYFARDEQMSFSPTLYMGHGGQRTHIHYDSSENLLHMIKGSKYFRIYDPMQASILLYGDQSVYNNSLPIDFEGDSWETEFPMAIYALQLELELLEGEILYLPMFWFHDVKSSPGTNLAVNFWYKGDSKKKTVFQRILCGYRHTHASFKC